MNCWLSWLPLCCQETEKSETTEEKSDATEEKSEATEDKSDSKDEKSDTTNETEAHTEAKEGEEAPEEAQSDQAPPEVQQVIFLSLDLRVLPVISTWNINPHPSWCAPGWQIAECLLDVFSLISGWYELDKTPGIFVVILE